MFQINEICVQLIRDLIDLMPKNISEFSHKLMSDEIIGEPIVFLSHIIEEYVNKEVIQLFSKPIDLIEEIDDKCEEMCVKCDVILDKMWEIINCCEWSKVKLDFRLCFGFVSLLKAVLKIKSVITSTDKELFEAELLALKTLDLGLLMSPKLTETNILAKFAKIIHKSVINLCLNESKRSSESESKSDFSKKLKLNKSQEKCNLNERQSFSCPTNPINNESDFQTLIPYFKNRVENQIKRVRDLDFDEFRDQYLITKTPVIITDCMSDWPALTHRKWSVDYIEKIAAYRTVPIEIGSKYTDEEWSQKLMTIKEFINEFILSSGTERRTGYLAQHNLFDQIEELMADICVPDYCSVSADLDSESVDVDINSWFGPAATVSPLHYDPKDNLLAQVFGHKYIRLYTDDTPPEHIYPNECRLLFNTSKVDVENVDSIKFPNFEKINNYCECLLKEGEILFIPKNYWHFVKSLSTSFSVSFWWK